jgi:hypothetical protein
VSRLRGVFVIALGLNFAWEMAQGYLYENMGTVWQATGRCLIASVGDAVMVLVALAMARRLSGRAATGARGREYALTIALAVIVGVVVEWWGLSTGRWAYQPQMPRAPGTEVGVVPVIQMVALMPLTLWLADRLAAGRARATL